MTKDDLGIRATPCDEALKWLADQPDLSTAWQQCDRGNWMLWLLEQPEYWYDDASVMRRLACRFAREVWHLMRDERSKTAVEVAERYAEDRATEAELDAAEAAAVAAADAAAWSGSRSAEAAAWSARTTMLKRQAEIIREAIPCPWEATTKGVHGSHENYR